MLRRLRAEAGETMVETLATLIILALGGVAVLTGIGVVANTSGDERTSSEAFVILQQTAEAVKGLSATCATDAYDSAASRVVLPSGWSASAIDISADCTHVENGVSLPTVAITVGTGGRTSESIVVVPRS
jgi:type II secretory pathway pseudopilin PulG